MECPATIRRAPARGHAWRFRLVLLVAALVAVLLPACSDAYTEEEKLNAEGGTNPAILTIYATQVIASSIDEIVKVYELANPGLNFVVVAGPTGVLAETIESGARPTIWIDDAVVQEPFLDMPDVVGEPKEIGFDVLLFFAAPGNPSRITNLDIFSGDASLSSTGLCQTSQPCGENAVEYLESLGIRPEPDIVYGDGLAVVNAVMNRQVDAGMAYRTDVSQRLRGVSPLPMPDADAGRIDFQAIQLVSNPNATDFIEWLQSSPDAIRILARKGLLPLSQGTV